MKALLDMDGVIANFVQGFIDHFGITDPYLDAKWHGNWQALFEYEQCPGKESEVWPQLGHDFWATLKPTFDCFTIISMLEQKFGKDNVCLLSSPARSSPNCMEGKLQWIRKYTPQFERRHLFGPAKQFATGPEQVLIDDGDHNIIAFTEAGGNAILIPRLWNSLYEQHEHPISHLMRKLDEL